MSHETGLSKEQILELLQLLDSELANQEAVGELHLVGGAVMCLALDARPATKALDAYFKPTQIIRDAVAKIAKLKHLPTDWLNDAVKGFLGDKSDWSLFLDLDHLKVYVATPEYLLALKAAAMRIGEGFQDLEDIRYLIRHLNIQSYKQALDVITRYIDLERLPQKTLYALEELLADSQSG
jgi:hypothetical protein